MEITRYQEKGFIILHDCTSVISKEMAGLSCLLLHSLCSNRPMWLNMYKFNLPMNMQIKGMGNYKFQSDDFVIILFLNNYYNVNLKPKQYASSYSIILYNFSDFLTNAWFLDQHTVVLKKKKVRVFWVMEIWQIFDFFSNRQSNNVTLLSIATDLISKVTDVRKLLASGFHKSNFYLNIQIWSLTGIILILSVYLEVSGWFPASEGKISASKHLTSHN